MRALPAGRSSSILLGTQNSTTFPFSFPLSHIHSDIPSTPIFWFPSLLQFMLHPEAHRGIRPGPWQPEAQNLMRTIPVPGVEEGGEMGAWWIWLDHQSSECGALSWEPSLADLEGGQMEGSETAVSPSNLVCWSQPLWWFLIVIHNPSSGARLPGFQFRLWCFLAVQPWAAFPQCPHL